MKRTLYIASTSLLLLSGGLFLWLGYEINRGAIQTADGSNEYVIILGAKVKPGGVPSKSLHNRLNVAAEYLQAHPHVTAIVSGGQGHDEDRTEASVMHEVLVEKGIASDRILLEEQATSTYENLLYAKALLPEQTSAVTIISNDFHLRRASFLAETLGLKADVIAAETPQSVELKSRIRERAALLKAFILKN